MFFLSKIYDTACQRRKSWLRNSNQMRMLAGKLELLVIFHVLGHMHSIKI